MSRRPDWAKATPPDCCPSCGHTFDTASNMTGAGGPSPGDLSLCISCGVVLRFDDQLRTVLAGDDWRDDLDREQVQALQTLRRRIRLRGEIATAPAGET